MNQKGMKMLAVRELLPAEKKVHLDKCVDCLDGKQNRPPFHPRPPMRRKNALELMHTDVDYLDAKSHADARYFVTFIDDNSWMLIVGFLLKTKDQVLSVFKEFQARAVSTDNGGEYKG